ncbi:initiation factor 2 [Xylariaceae sp. FL0804]|nr:initiation factor 2 [Xylariaceae sp. FL0804]
MLRGSLFKRDRQICALCRHRLSLRLSSPPHRPLSTTRHLRRDDGDVQASQSGGPRGAVGGDDWDTPIFTRRRRAQTPAQTPAQDGNAPSPGRNIASNPTGATTASDSGNIREQPTRQEQRDAFLDSFERQARENMLRKRQAQAPPGPMNPGPGGAAPFARQVFSSVRRGEIAPRASAGLDPRQVDASGPPRQPRPPVAGVRKGGMLKLNLSGDPTPDNRGFLPGGLAPRMREGPEAVTPARPSPGGLSTPPGRFPARAQVADPSSDEIRARLSLSDTEIRASPASASERSHGVDNEIRPPPPTRRPDSLSNNEGWPRSPPTRENQPATESTASWALLTHRRASEKSRSDSFLESLDRGSALPSRDPVPDQGRDPVSTVDDLVAARRRKAAAPSRSDDWDNQIEQKFTPRASSQEGKRASTLSDDLERGLHPKPEPVEDRHVASPAPVQEEARSSDRGRDRPSKKDKKRGGKKQSGKGYDEEDLEDEEDDGYDRHEEWRRLKAERKAQRAAEQGPPQILLPELISINALAGALKIKPEEFLEQLGELGFENVTLDSLMVGDTAALVVQEYGFEPTVETGEGHDLKPRPPPEDPSVLPLRPPVVTIMGHVDHGKTTLLDYLRKSSVAAQEHGGITQHIGAFSVKLSSGRPITFLDTPGHAAFLTMRQRGANVTDIVVLVIAADDSVKPQTIEALNHARASKVPIIVAINKIDKEGAQVDHVKSDLAKAGVEIEDYGGDVQVVETSGKTGQGMDDLEENILTLSEILDHRAEVDGPAEGWILESSLKASGKTATALIKRGTLRTGDIIAAGVTHAKVRHLRNEAGVEITEAPPGTPVEILGWRDLPAAGDMVLQAPDESTATRAIAYREGLKSREQDAADYEVIGEARKARKALAEKRAREKAAAAHDGRAAEYSYKEWKSAVGRGAVEEEEAAALPDVENGTKMVNFVVKGDVHGSVEAVCASVLELGNHEVRPRILRSATGALSEFDVEHAALSGSTVLNFSTTTPAHIDRLAEQHGVRVLDHNVIYRLVDDVRAVLSGHLAPEVSTRVLGEAEILQVFPINLKGRVYKNIAGCRVRNGVIARNSRYRVLRGGEKLFDGKLETLKQVKKDVTEVRKGNECGMGFPEFQDFEAGDQIQAYEEISTKRTL